MAFIFCAMGKISFVLYEIFTVLPAGGSSWCTHCTSRGSDIDGIIKNKSAPVFCVYVIFTVSSEENFTILSDLQILCVP